MNLPRLSFLALVSLCLVSRLTSAAGPDASWLPAATVGYVSVADAERVFDAWKGTSPGKLFDSRVFQPFFKSIWEGQEKSPFTVSWLQGLTLDEVLKAGGSVLVAVVAEEGQPPALLLLLDSKGRHQQVEALLRQVSGRLEQMGASRARTGPATVFDLPPRQALGPMKQLAYAAQDGVLVASTRPGLVQDVLKRKSSKGSTLADSPAFQATTSRALKEAEGAKFSWFVEPLSCLLALRGLTGEKVKGPDMLKILHKEGFAAIKGAGGAIWIDDRTGELLLRGFVRAPRPYQRALRMMDFTEGAHVEPPTWVPGDATQFGTMTLRFTTSFEASGYLFDALYGEGEEGVFDEVIKGLRDDPVGPKVDVRKDLIGRMRAPAYFLERLEGKNATDDWLIACPVADVQVVARSVDRLFKDDRAARRSAFGDHGLWEILPDKVQANTKGNGRDKAGKDTDWAIPASAIAVHKETLFLGGSPDLIRHLFRHDQPLARDAEYQSITSGLERVAGKSCSLRLFYRLGPMERQTLTELRSGKTKEAQALTRFVRALLLGGSDRPTGGIDFSKLPAPDEVSALLTGSAGLSANLTEDTWSFVFLLQGK